MTWTEIAHWGSVLKTGRIVLFVTTFGSLLGLFWSPSSSKVKNAFHSLVSLCCDVLHVGSLCGELHSTYRHWASRAELQVQHAVDPRYYDSSSHIKCTLTHWKSSLTLWHLKRIFMTVTPSCAWYQFYLHHPFHSSSYAHFFYSIVKIILLVVVCPCRWEHYLHLIWHSEIFCCTRWFEICETYVKIIVEPVHPGA